MGGKRPAPPAVVSGASQVESCRGQGGQNDPCYWRFEVSPSRCGGKCSKMVVFFGGGEMKCDDSQSDPDSVYSKILKGYQEDGYLAVCAGLFLESDSAARVPFNKNAVRVDTLLKDIQGSPTILSHWSGEHLLLAGVSYGATAPVVAMARTNLEEQSHWKGSRTTAACFHDGVYDPIAQDAFLDRTPRLCNPLRNRLLCERYFGENDCPDLSPSDPEVALDRVVDAPASNFTISHWKLVECGSRRLACTLNGDWVPAEPISALCSQINSSGGNSCVFDSLPWQSHLQCSGSSNGIAICRDWFDGLLK